MKLNAMSPAPGSKKVRLRVGRGASAGQGKTCGRGVKGQRARKGGYHKVGFEGGQMPIQRRLPKTGFRSKVAPTVAEVRLLAPGKLQFGGVLTVSSSGQATVRANGQNDMATIIAIFEDGSVLRLQSSTEVSGSQDVLETTK